MHLPAKAGQFTFMLHPLKKEVFMFRKFHFILLAVVLVAGLSGCKKSSDENTEESLDVSEHDNWVVFIPMDGSPTLSFTLTGHVITSGQPWSGVVTGSQGGSWALDAKAGRHNSSGCASWFHNRCSNADCCNWPSGCNPWPDELNFAFTGTLTIDGTAYNITIGQGSDGIHNNWWFGGPGWTSWSSPFGDAVVTPDQKYYFEAEDDTFNSIYIRLKP
jgi:hypothetical protein